VTSSVTIGFSRRLLHIVPALIRRKWERSRKICLQVRDSECENIEYEAGILKLSASVTLCRMKWQDD